MSFTWDPRTLDERYPRLSAMVLAVLGVDLETLASRAPAQGFDHFDLERMLAQVRATPASYGDSVADATFGVSAAQVRGYLATIEAFIGLGVITNPGTFVKKKLRARPVAAASPQGTEMLDTLAECSWGLWLHDNCGNLEFEKPLPAIGDADFYVSSPNGPLWIDCISVEPSGPQDDLAGYLANVVVAKWRKKFGRRPGARSLPAAIAVTLLKAQEHIMPALIRDQITGTPINAPPSVWVQCPGLQVAWFGVPPFHEGPHRPDIVTPAWKRP